MKFLAGIAIGASSILLLAVWSRMYVKTGTWKPWEWTWEDWK